MASLYAQKNLSTAQTDLASSVQKLSSGKRINSAKDDAAGYAVAEAVKATKNVTDQSIQNTQDAISMVQTAEGALEVVGKILQRALTLTTEKENGSLTEAQKSSINSEITSLFNEIDQVKTRTKFQGGSASLFGSTQTFTTGDGSSTTVAIGDLTKARLGAVTVTGGTAASAATAIALSSGNANPGIIVGSVIMSGTATIGTVSAVSSDGLTLTLSAGATDVVASTHSLTVAHTISSSSTSGQIMAAVQNNIVARTDLGTWQNRLNYIVDNMQTLSNNLADAQSRIIDTDYASETAKLTRGQILQQAATSMLAQANQMPNVILTLLK